jgi:hypothetical protein
VSVSCVLHTYRKLVDGQMVKRKQVVCTVTRLSSAGKVRAKLTKAGQRRATGSASAKKGRARIVLGEVKRGSYRLTLVTMSGTIKLAVALK